MSQTKKPCPGCGNRYWRDADKLCNPCQEKFYLADKLLTSQKADSETVNVPRAYYELPYLFVSNLCGDGGDERKQLQEAFYNVIMAVSDEAKWQVDLPMKFGNRSIYAQPECRAFRPGVPEKLEALWQAIETVVGCARKAGMEQGQNLLARLCDGSLTMESHDKDLARQME